MLERAPPVYLLKELVCCCYSSGANESRQDFDFQSVVRGMVSVGMAVELSWKVWLSTRERNFQEMRSFFDGRCFGVAVQCTVNRGGKRMKMCDPSSSLPYRVITVPDQSFFFCPKGDTDTIDPVLVRDLLPERLVIKLPKEYGCDVEPGFVLATPCDIWDKECNIPIIVPYRVRECDLMDRCTAVARRCRDRAKFFLGDGGKYESFRSEFSFVSRIAERVVPVL